MTRTQCLEDFQDFAFCYECAGTGEHLPAEWFAVEAQKSQRHDIVKYLEEFIATIIHPNGDREEGHSCPISVPIDTSKIVGYPEYDYRKTGWPKKE